MTTTEVAKPLFEKLPGNIFNGIYTVSSAKGHRTFKVATVHDPESKLYGRRIIYLMNGPDNLFDYAGVAFLDNEDGKDVVKIWRRQKGTAYHKAVLAFLHVLGSEAVDAAAGADPRPHTFGTPDEGWQDYKVEEARNCLVCNRLLTRPDSIARGIGPTHLGLTAEGDDNE